MQADKIKICSKSVIDETTYGNVKFLEDGTSEYYVRLCGLMEEKRQNTNTYVHYFDNIIKRAGKGNYHAVLGISGGADSSMLAVICKKMGLKILLVHMDNHWNTSIAENNLNEVQKFTGFEFQRYTLDKDSFFDLQISFLKSSTPDLENPTDIAILGALSETANKYGIKNILLATNFENEGFVPQGWHYDCRDDKYLKAIHRLFGKIKLKNFPFYDYKKEIRDKLLKNIYFYYPFNIMLYDKEKAKQELKKNMNWLDYKEHHHESTYTAFVQKYILPEKFGIDYRKIFLTAQICSGKISREAALSILRSKPYNPETIESEKKEISEKLGIKLNELNEYLSLPNKKYTDYPNNKIFISKLYKMYYLLYQKLPYSFYQIN